ncbi:MAG: thioredoxin family protein [Fuerstiella sp.]|nr:thioredoxin family protein [Fuerstiella sp.]MCP4859400.1 thioredoxin family protein [Fuerstiella sp.]
MTWNRVRVVGYLCALLVVSASAMGGGWERDFETALSRARDSEQPLLIHFHANWCGPCRNMERNVLNTADVLSALTKNIVGVKVESDTRRDLIQWYGITTLPSDVIIEGNGNVLHRASGTASRSGYVAKLIRFGRRSRIQTSTTVTKPAPRRSIKVTQRTQLRVPTQTQQRPMTVALQAQTVAVEQQPGAVEEMSVVAKETTVAMPEQTIAVQEQVVDAPARRTFDAEFAQIDNAEDPDPSLSRSLRRKSGRRIGLNAYCPVALSTGAEWVMGTTEFRHEYQSVSYFMSSAAQLKRFMANPGKYVPYLHGCDPVALRDEDRIQSGAIELGASYQERVYFFANERNRAAFLEAPERFSAEQAVAVIPPGTASDG